MSRWAAFPDWWIRMHLLPKLEAGQQSTGEHIAALKLYFVIAIAADYFTGEAEIGLTDLGVLAGLSRPMVTAGLRVLEELGVVSVDRSGYRSVYRLLQTDEETHLGRVPVDLVRFNLRNISNRSTSSLGALKLYLTLLVLRQRNSNRAVVAHTTLQKYTGVRPNELRKGISHLITHGFLHVVQSERVGTIAGRPVNEYILKGDFGVGSSNPNWSTDSEPSPVV